MSSADGEREDAGVRAADREDVGEGGARRIGGRRRRRRGAGDGGDADAGAGESGADAVRAVLRGGVERAVRGRGEREGAGGRDS